VNNPLVSVVIPFLDAERFIREAISSVFAQTYSHWELLLVDDGSSDGSSAIAQYYADRFPLRVRYLEHGRRQNRGVAASRNLGVRQARGKLLAFLDADDVWLPHKLEQQVQILDVQPEAAMVYGATQWWYSWTGKWADLKRDHIEPLGVPGNTLIRPPELLISLFFLQKAAIPCPCSILIRREALERVGGFEESFVGISAPYEDQAFCAKLFLNERVLAIDECWDRYRQHADSAVSRLESNNCHYMARSIFLEWLAQYLASQGVHDPVLLKALRQERWRCRHPKAAGLLNKSAKSVLSATRSVMPRDVRQWVRARVRRTGCAPSVGQVRLGDLRRVTPLNRDFGYSRGTPVDRYYIERFLAENAASIRGRVLEVADNTYTRRFGGDRVRQSDVLHVNPQDANATIIGDLTHADHIPSDSFDCVILTQTLQVIYDVPAALRTIHRILTPGGVALVTVPGISPISRYDMDRWGYFWAFTSLSVERLFQEAFGDKGEVTIQTYGNVLAATAFLFGLALEELKPRELDYADPDYQVIIAFAAKKSQ
jgi:glycosyltransferase involved in cell wall biosynthesis/SAM-dependent methyltransferase